MIDEWGKQVLKANELMFKTHGTSKYPTAALKVKLFIDLTKAKINLERAKPRWKTAKMERN